MFADMVGYTALMQEDENRARAQRDRFVGALSRAVGGRHGEILQHYGDGALSVFDSAVEAVEAAVALQEELRHGPRVPVRVGVHAGDIVYGADEVYGDGVNVASRIEPLAAPGGVMVSGKVYDEIKNHVSLSAEPRGKVRLKNVKRPIRVFAMTNEGLSVPTAEDVRSKAWEPPATEAGAGVTARQPAQAAPEAKRAAILRRVGERSLLQWGFAYAAGAWAFLEAADFAEGAFRWPASVSRALVVGVVVGLPVTLVVAWYHGKKGRQRVTGPELLAVGLLLAAGGAAMAVVGPGGEEAARAPIGPREAPALAELPSVAVLPFANMSGTPEVEPFAVGIHDDVLTQLSKIGGLRVISRTSVLGYRDTRLSVPEIARELGVGAILEGGVQRVSNRIRMNAQLVDAETDGHLWAERFDTVYTVENIFAIQSAIATAIAEALEAVLTPVELAVLGEIPTDDNEAYELYLSGIEHLARPGWAANDLALAQQDFEDATAADPDFALAWAHLAVVHFLHFRVTYDTSVERLELIREAAERSLVVDPDLPEAHLALSHYYSLTRQMDQALAELAVAGQGLPNDPWVPVGVALVRQRQGSWDEAVERLERAIRLDPRNPEFSFLLGDTYVKMRRWDRAVRQFDRTLSLAPGMTQAVLSKTLVLLFRDGNVEPMLTAIEEIPPGEDFGGAPAFFTWWGRFLARDFEGSEEPLAFLGPVPTGWPMPYSPALLKALSRWHDGRRESARGLMEAELPSLENDARERPDQPGPHEALGIAYAILGRSTDAVREGRLATELLPISSDAYDGPLVLTDLARIYALMGEVELAIDQLEILISIPGDVSPPLLAVDPIWDPLRDAPRFRALVAG
jgi:TolB-like protein/Flp pilus assembly protein TadD